MELNKYVLKHCGRWGIERIDVEVNVWLRIEGKKRYASWTSGKVECFKTKPTTSDKELAFKLNLVIPDEVFEEPVFEATIKLPKSVRNLPPMAEVQENIANELRKQTGFKINISLPTETKEIAT